MTRIGALLLAGLLLVGCEREERDFRSAPAETDPVEKIAMTTLAAGGQPPEKQQSAIGRKFEQNATHVSRGKTLFAQFNCAGCHGNGGGGSGPALMDSNWTYGSDIENIAATILEGRPNGMPSFRGRIADEQVWQLAAYVRALGGFVPKDTAPSRSDTLQAHEAENRILAPTPVPHNPAPPAGSMPQ
jgi:cytochrome c oxidase cbb3-type subunit III